MIFTPHTQRAIRNKGMSAIYGLAAEFDCEPGDVLDLLVTTSFTHASGDDRPLTPDAVERLLTAIDELEPTPSQPELTSLDPAADTFAVPPASETDGECRNSSSPAPAPSVITIHQSHQAETLGEAVAATGGDAATDKPVRSKGLAASLQKSVKQQVRELHAEHPDWNSRQIAVALPTCNSQTISVALSDIRGEERAAEDIATQTRLIAEAAGRRSQPEKTAPDGRTLGERVKALNKQYPNWNARIIANHLGAPFNSVRTMLSTAKAEAKSAAPEFAGKEALQTHYAAVGKRLGKSS